jgi:DNA-binding SARP family transcriptional activator
MQIEPHLYVRCLGNFQYRGNGDWESGPAFKHGREFLEYMSAYPRAAASHHTLEEAFWPGRESDAVRHRLHMAVTGARAALRRALPAVNPIRVLPGAYAWNPTIRIESDYWQLLACWDEGSVAAMTRGIAIYEGEFCSGDSAEWMYALRARASAAYIAMLQGLAEDALTRGDNQTVARYALRVVEADRGHEGAVRLAMRAFAEMGSRSAAIKEYEALRRWLRLNLATEPSVLTKALREKVIVQA